MNVVSGIYRIRIDRGVAPPKFYIGQAAIFEKRWASHLRTLRLGKHKNQPLQRAFAKYGEVSLSFEILLICRRNDLNFYEKMILDSLPDDAVYNLCRACVGSKLGVPMTLETKAKISAANKGRRLGPEQREAVRQANMRRVVSAETREKMSLSHMGNKNSLGHKQTDNHRQKVREFFKGKKKPAEEIAKRQETRAANRAARNLGIY